MFIWGFRDAWVCENGFDGYGLLEKQYKNFGSSRDLFTVLLEWFIRRVSWSGLAALGTGVFYKEWRGSSFVRSSANHQMSVLQL